LRARFRRSPPHVRSRQATAVSPKEQTEKEREPLVETPKTLQGTPAQQTLATSAPKVGCKNALSRCISSLARLAANAQGPPWPGTAITMLDLRNLKAFTPLCSCNCRNLPKWLIASINRIRQWLPSIAGRHNVPRAGLGARPCAVTGPVSWHSLK
jgi:hypothetical protein